MLRELHQELGITEDDNLGGRRPVFEEAVDLVDVGHNLVGRMQNLDPETARQRAEMVAAAEADGVTLLIVSGFRDI